MATWDLGPIKVCFGNRRGIIGRITFSGAGTEDFATGLKLVDRIGFQAIGATTDNIFNVYRNTTTTTDNAGDTPGTVHVVNVAASTFSVIAVGK